MYCGEADAMDSVQVSGEVERDCAQVGEAACGGAERQRGGGQPVADELGGDSVVGNLVGGPWLGADGGEGGIDAATDAQPVGKPMSSSAMRSAMSTCARLASGWLGAHTKTKGSRVNSRSAMSGEGGSVIDTRARSIRPSAIASRCPAEPARLWRRRTVTNGLCRRKAASRRKVQRPPRHQRAQRDFPSVDRGNPRPMTGPGAPHVSPRARAPGRPHR